MAQQLAHSQQLKYPKYRNWVKAGLGLKYLKEGLETFSDDVIDQQHTDIINVVQKKHNLPMVNCGQCNLRNLQPDHVRNNNKQCPLGQNNCNCMFPGGKITCPNNVCGAIYDEIIINHASNPPAPNWKNTDVQNWCTDAWAVAKCYINAPGYTTKRNAKEIDCTGLLRLYINSKYLQRKIQCKITGQDVFTKTRSARNIIYHSNSMEMEDIEVDEYIDNMIAVLEDGKELINRQESQDAVIKLKELKNSSIVISTQDEAVVIKEAFTEIDQMINDLKETIQEGDETVTQKGNAALQAVQKTREQLENRAKEILDNIKKVASDSKHDIEMELKKALHQIKTAVNVNATSAEKAKDFQRSLVEMYLEYVVKVSPVLLHPERTDTVISQLYVDPYLEIEPREKGNTQEKTRVSSYTEVFEKDGKPLKLIYLIGEAGSGKSTFCIDMIHKWCLAHSEQRTQESENVQFMKKFKYLFYIYLRHNMDADRIETMIRNHYENDVLEPILTKESGDCLILLDGLDEWTATEQQRTVSQFQTKGLPIRDLRKKYTVITTSRPWKFESLSIKSTENNQTLRLRGVFDVDEMARKTVNELNEMFRMSKNKADFDKDFSKCSFEDDMKRMPMVIQQLVCLWFDGKLKQFGKSEIYSNMISLYFEWADRRNPDDHVLKNLKEKSILSRDVILPNQCIRTELCEEHKYVIHHVGRLAYKTLFSE
ncbi:uncharacterized protein LOC123561885 isoform X1 [Mercenaria mercenaria]|uniref:uncharacterized protein LOC123561885 isoform X1 n=1 Tax=Mercenaria mercenaria TaxID=6596 RepID=UPI00234F07AB|nr:uncharacterized protein LOC123561885 isoform X1 [Mercenaria mercenaria]XP_053408753.1 uncharacterized protein LOC123561885 isoform X1 [Mercenaria mercenaria]XP_053408754.1 uncharacterized protein LOC123561885 isoform X1 [Mercenaria mercenaria]XP_053408755.1 uncharacterized protein LOC123561885 isoform X1 [Mercenaria mercenaria]XP_053408756.1 uncharacterized protein LOC123561885 isoform X1 [Mercenaria mercenaria]XP_053408757.1 uncharacterized protein LOC123561885 isoform X1 [Mercenaria merce